MVVGRECTIGAGTVLHPHVTLYDHSWIGQDCIVHGGAVLGSDGFSFHPTADGVVKVPQVGRVVVHDGVEIGANTTVDRAFLRETVLGQGTKLDNLVQIGHNSKIGRSNLFAAQVGLSGSVTTGDGVVLAGKVGVGDHAQLEDGVIAGAGAGLLGRVKTGTWWGFPASEIRLAKRMAMAARQLPALLKTVRALERRLAALEEGNPEADG